MPKKWQVDYLLGMLHERYIVSLPRLRRDTAELCNTSPQRLRWLWCSWAAKLLGWKERLLEGHAKGFSAEVYTILREIVFPFPKIERDSVDRQASSSHGVESGGLSGRGSVSTVAAATVADCTRLFTPCSGGTSDFGSYRVVAQSGEGEHCRKIDCTPAESKHQFWLEGKRNTGYLDNNNHIIWDADPKRTLAPWVYRRLLSATGTTDPSATSSPTSEEGIMGSWKGLQACTQPVMQQVQTPGLQAALQLMASEM
jgi:hypothetical protein